MTTTTARYAGSLVGLTAGAELEPLVLPGISRTTLAFFAGASGDANPIHVDIDVARSAGLEDVFAHGMLSMAYLGRLLTDWVPQERIRSYRVRFVALTPVHARPTCYGVIRSVDNGLATLDLAVRLADGTTTVTGTAVIDLTDAIDRTTEEQT